ncbi:MAG: hypothetical protein OFPII_08470 [Osedax symbiont Rs1]|nr:MAG: hypothetical protein OFPII_08470 [Osedax symbiont Rs1]
MRGILTPLSRRFLPCIIFARNVMQRSHFKVTDSGISMVFDATLFIALLFLGVLN